MALDPITAGAIIGGGSALLGGLHRDRSTTKDHKRTLAHQDYWNRNKYQATVEDLKKAGLNPILAYRNPATAQSGATAGPRENIGAQVTTAAREGALLKAQADNLNADTAKKKQETLTSGALEGHYANLQLLSQAQTAEVWQKFKHLKFDTDLYEWLNKTIPGPEVWGPKTLETGIRSVAGVAQAVKGFADIFKPKGVKSIESTSAKETFGKNSITKKTTKFN